MPGKLFLSDSIIMRDGMEIARVVARSTDGWSIKISMAI